MNLWHKSIGTNTFLGETWTLAIDLYDFVEIVAEKNVFLSFSGRQGKFI